MGPGQSNNNRGDSAEGAGQERNQVCHGLMIGGRGKNHEGRGEIPAPRCVSPAPGVSRRQRDPKHASFIGDMFDSHVIPQRA